MKSDWSFPGQIFLALLIVGSLGLYPLLKLGSAEMLIAALAGALLSLLNVLLGYAAIEYSADKSTKTFFKAVLGGMGIRLLLIAVLLVLFIKIARLHVGALVGSMGIFYIVFLTLEIFYIQKKVTTKHQSGR